MIQVRRNRLIVNNSDGQFVTELNVSETITAIELAELALITVAEAQALLDSRVTDDTNNLCCDSPAPTINSITAVGNYSDPGSITITVDITNPDTDEYNMIVSENGVVLLDYTGTLTTNTINNLTFVPRQKRIFDIQVTTSTCSATVTEIETVSLGPEGFTYGMANALQSGTLDIGQMFKNSTTGGQIVANIGDSIQIQYFTNAWYDETKTVTLSNGSGISFDLNTPFAGFPTSNSIGTPIFGRFRNLTTGGNWLDYGQQIPVMYP